MRISVHRFLNFQSPRSGQCLCNAELKRLEEPNKDFQSPRSGQCLCNPLHGSFHGCICFPFSPLVRGNASAISNSAACPSYGESLSVPSFGAMPLQSATPIVKMLLKIFQSPRSGQCLCNSDNNYGQRFTTDFQSPRSGQCLCNAGPVWSHTSFSVVFQSPRSGQCLCNARIGSVNYTTVLNFQSPRSGQCLCNTEQLRALAVELDCLSVPSFGAMPLQSRG